MEAILNILIFLAFFIFLIVMNIRVMLQVKKDILLEANILIVSFLISANLFFLVNLCSTFNFPFFGESVGKFLMGSQGFMAFSALAFTVIALVKDLTSKKLRTLLRLPLIGLLLGVYLKTEYVMWVWVGMETVLSIYLFQVREKQNYIFRQQVKGWICLLLFYIASSIKLGNLSYIGIILFLLMKFQIINALRLKLLFSNEDERDVEES